MLKEKKVGELGFLAECENCSAEGSTNVLATTADNLFCIEAQAINFADYKTFEEIIGVLDRMEQLGLHLVGSNLINVFKSSKMAEVVQTFKEMKENSVDETGIFMMLPLLTRTCNLRLQVYRIYVDDFDIGKIDNIVDNNKMSKVPHQRRSAVLDLPMG